MVEVPASMHQRLQRYGQEHVLRDWEQLGDGERRTLLDQLERLDLEQLRQLYEQRNSTWHLPALDALKPAPTIRLDADQQGARAQGEEALRAGEVAVLLVAGGQGSRLGFEHPKGMFPIGPISQKSLFQIHAEKVLALGRRYGKPLPFLVMTSPGNAAETQDFFAQHRSFGLGPSNVHFFTQGTMPALDFHSGKLLMEAPGRLFTSPNGHGGSLTALADAGLLAKLHERGIRHVFYFQVDNPLVKVADPVFLGHHLRARAEVSSKVVAKKSAEDKLGNLLLANGRCTMIEYSDMPKPLAQKTDEQGNLVFWAGSPAIHIFDLGFLGQVTQGHTRIPFHVARKKVPHIDEKGKLVQPAVENALKFEMFVFDVLPRAERWTVVETSRREEFEPLKNATGADSPESVRQALCNLTADWLERAGVRVPRQSDGNAAVPLEISPLYALDAIELVAKLDKDDRQLQIKGPTYLE